MCEEGVRGGLQVLHHRSYGRADELLGAICVNLHEIATGPVLYDLPLLASLDSKDRARSGARLRLV